MSQIITQGSLFQKCIDEPITYQLSELNLSKLQQSQTIDTKHEQQNLQKDALRILYRTWSGATKYLKQVCLVLNKPVELPGIGMLCPSNQQLNKLKLTSQALSQVEIKDPEVILIVYSKFLQQNNIVVAQKNQKQLAISQDSEDAQQCNVENLQRINFSSIAKVCDTDSSTIEIIFKEIQAQIQNIAKNGQNLRLDFKIGRLELKNGELYWKLPISYTNNQETEKIDQSTFESSQIYNDRYSKDTRKSRLTQQLRMDNSVMTPTMKSRAQSIIKSNSLKNGQNFHVSNPNPQSTSYYFKGARDLGYKKYYERLDSTQKYIKFGKKVDYGINQLSSEQLMQEHLKQIREKFSQQQYIQLSRKQQEKEFLNQLQYLENMNQQKKEISKKILFDDMNQANESMKKVKQDFENTEIQFRKVDRYNYFPFIGSETIERQRAQINNKLKDDLKSYMSYQQQLSKSQARQRNDLSSFKADDTSTIEDKANYVYQQNKNQAVKHLYDSSYVLPKDNYRVFQDTHPVKSAAINEAQKRFEMDLQFKNQLHDEIINNHKQKIQSDNQNYEQELQNKAQKQIQFKNTIREQIEFKKTQKQLEDSDKKLFKNTHFGPQEDQQLSQSLIEKKSMSQNLMKTELKKQIEKNFDQKSQEETFNIELEKLDTAYGKSIITKNNQKKKEYAYDAQQHWKNELQKLKEFKSQLPKGLDVVTKLK